MSDKSKGLDLIERAAERLVDVDAGSIPERAALKLAEGISAGGCDAVRVVPKSVNRARAASKAKSVKTRNARRRTAPARANADPGKHVEIDLQRLDHDGYVTPEGARSRLAEEFRVVKRPLLLKAFEPAEDAPPNNLIMVTSARPNEGKTFTTLNLAMSLASERELFVLLIDADVRKHSLVDMLGIECGLGLVDLLNDESLDLADVMVRTNVPNLTILSPGTDHQNATELLASARMGELMSEIASRYKDRVILIDTAPVLASSETSVMALYTGQTVLVVDSGETTNEAIEQSLPLIESCPNINFVVNRSRQAASGNRFGAYSYYYEAKTPTDNNA